MIRFFRIFFLLFICSELYAQSQKGYAANSLLSSGTWIKAAITSDGIYRVDYNTLKQKGLSDPSNPRIYCNNDGQLSYYNDGTANDDFRETAIWINEGTDGLFNEGDYLLFFGKGTHRWEYNYIKKEYEFRRHNYSDTAFYFITSGNGQGKRIKIVDSPAKAATYSSSQSDELIIHELENVNLIKSGREWFERMPFSPMEINPGFTDLEVTENIKVEIRGSARSQVSSDLAFSESGQTRKILKFQAVNYSNYNGTYASICDSVFSFKTNNPSPVFSLKYINNGEQAGEAWLDFVKFQARVNTTFNGKFSLLRDSRSIAPGQISSFKMKSQANDAIIWDVSDLYNPVIINYSKTGDYITFKAVTDSLRTFAVFTMANVMTPKFSREKIPNQNLHGSETADMIIVTYPLFREYAEKIAGIHMKRDSISSLVVTPGDIYNEFSGGIPDIAAIRNFARMKYLKQKGSSRPLKYLLLFGDGSYENKTPPPRNPSYIPTYQSKNSNVFVMSFTSDDFFSLLEDGEGEADGTEDIGVGRLPVSDTVQAGIMISKIRKYTNPANMGDWRNIISIVADDEDGNAHMSDAEGLASEITANHPEYNLKKIYLDAYKQVTTASGQSYPDVNTAINDRINSGCLIFNYVGHGDELGLAHERVVKTSDINSWRNGGKLPLIITATCEFSRFDNMILLGTGEMAAETSAGELALINKDGGAIALMSTTRVVYSGPNYFLNRNIYNTIFEKDEAGNLPRLGDVIRIAKMKSGKGSNKRNFLLLGDPALRLAIPDKGRVITDSINGVTVSGKIDSLKALSLITISGHIENNIGNISEDFNGTLFPTVFDKENRTTTLANDGGPSFNFPELNSILFSGRTSIQNGQFRFSFLVPSEINYEFANGKISYYANNQEGDVNGYFNRIIVGGFARSTISDTEGPVIKLFINDTLFRNRGMTDKSPILLAILEDKGGINTTGAAIGHDITMFLDDERKPMVLNNFFTTDIDNYSRGRLYYNFSDLDEGLHSLTLKAWDNYNNSSEGKILFIVNAGGKLVLNKLINYPNPFTEHTSFTAEINRPGEYLEIMISIFDIGGRIIKQIKKNIFTEGYRIAPIEWDGRDDRGERMAGGMYPYVVSVSTPNGETSRQSGRMIIF